MSGHPEPPGPPGSSNPGSGTPGDGAGGNGVPPGAPRGADRRSLRRAGAAFLATSLLLNLSTPLDFLDSFLLGGLLVLLPFLAVIQLRMLREEPLERSSIYLGSAITILLLGATALVVGVRRIGWEGMGLRTMPFGEFAAWTIGLTVAGLALIGLFHLVSRRLGLVETPLLEQLLPETRSEKLLFAGLSLAAGLGEEIAYRAYAITAIALALSPMWIPGGAPPGDVAAGAAPDTGVWISAALASAAFGFLHAYQGMIGIVRTALLGFVLAVSFLMTGNLWPAIAAHALIDLVAGLVIGKHMIPRGNEHGN